MYEIEGLKPEARTALNAGEFRETMLFAGRKWIRLFAANELAVDERRIVPLEDFDLVVVRLADGHHAFNNACPHMHLPLYEPRVLAEGELGYFPGTDTPRPTESAITEDRGVVCRWHHSCFNLQTGEVKDWATRLAEDGTSPGWEFLGDVSKNRTKLTVYTCRIHGGHLWVALQ